MNPFSKILIANRGEIACRVMRSARALGYRSVAVYSDADADAPHVHLADEAVALGGLTATDSYLNVAAVLAAAERSGAQALHPGYGFLSENAAFAAACIDAGLVFIGPPPAAISAMADKAAAKRRMIAAGVPTIPGYLEAEQSDARLIAAAAELGFPLLVKAVAGGGGRGIRRAMNAAELPEALASARREAQSAFGDATLMLERLIEQGRHIEIQVFADAHGNAVHLGERDCSAQRRRQKVIEEAPSPSVDAAMRAQMGRDAVAAALAVGYRGAGTVEFIVDRFGKHYFLEMNTRLQVEHPVTEMITGVDLVEWQLRVAAGEVLPLTQEQIRFDGHAIEVRLYAEDPYDNFTPQTGRIDYFRPQAALQPGVRIDAGIAEGAAVTPFYDPMLAKFIAHGRDRNDARRRLTLALEDAPVFGVRHNARFLRDLLNHPSFAAGQMHTTLLDEWSADATPIMQRPAPDAEDWALAAALLVGAPGWRARSVAGFDLTLSCGDEVCVMRIDFDGAALKVGSGGTAIDLHILDNADGRVRYRSRGLTRKAFCRRDGERLMLARAAAVWSFAEVSPLPQGLRADDSRFARAAVAGAVARIDVAPGDAVAAGQTLAVIEAMKMEMRVKSAAAGKVAAVRVHVGEQVEAGAILVELEPNPTN
ncbi:MAG TPA: biotin carboxylase N-terminal domain-containing protein [Rhodocyclaceae bacterium]|nr:biotin carboxylase N-terminal domain-containing protein [Rhodocyclaceae bacterium]